MAKVKRGKVVSYNKWGYIFLIPFIVVYLIFQLVPLFRTFYYSFFENYRSGHRSVPTLSDYRTLLQFSKIPISGFIPRTH